MGQQVRVYDLEKAEEKSSWSIAEGDSIMSLALTQDSRYLLVNLIKQQIHLWPLAAPNGRSLSEPLQIYEGLQERRGRCVYQIAYTCHCQLGQVEAASGTLVEVLVATAAELVASIWPTATAKRSVLKSETWMKTPGPHCSR